MAFVELTENNVVKSKVLINVAHIVKVETRRDGPGSVVYTTPKADGNNAVYVTETYETIRARLTGEPAPGRRDRPATGELRLA
ncbi:hypothetical protein [Salinarimonas sp.]|uniref:hypothetical protein n=1 Tax=Salinarimonas sp. TaxID=2766526 RepID=UPI0032D9452C